jgi:tetratricopeptide (TPR) repeat protein
MNRKMRRVIGILLALSCLTPGLGWAQGQGELAGTLNAGFDLMEQGKFGQAQKLYEGVLRQDPGQPLALNNMAAILVKQGKYDQALVYLKRALPRAQGLKVGINRVCNVDGVCAAARLGAGGQFGSEDLDAVIKGNILMLEIARSSRPGAK